MNKVWLVATREYMENARTKTFWISLLAFPILITASGFFSVWLGRSESERKFVIVDDGSGLAPALRARLEFAPDPRYREVLVEGGDAGSLIQVAQADVAADRLFAFVTLPADLLTTGTARYVSKNLTDRDLLDWLRRHLEAEVHERRLSGAGLDPTNVRKLLAPVQLGSDRVTSDGTIAKVEKKDTARQWLPVAFVYILWFAVFLTSQMLLNSTIEEKSNRLMEVLLASISPRQIMKGKILGIALTGLTVLGAWVLYFFIALKALPLILGKSLPVDFGGLVADPLYLTSFLFYFVCGYSMIAAITAGIGSLCSTAKEAQGLYMPLTMVLVVPLMTMAAIGKDPNSTLAKILSMIPIYTPFVMMNRAAGPPEVWEYVVSTIIMVGATLLAFRMAARLFQLGVLMTGKPPKLGEIWKLLRTTNTKA